MEESGVSQDSGSGVLSPPTSPGPPPSPAPSSSSAAARAQEQAEEDGNNASTTTTSTVAAHSSVNQRRYHFDPLRVARQIPRNVVNYAMSQLHRWRNRMQFGKGFGYTDNFFQPRPSAGQHWTRRSSSQTVFGPTPPNFRADPEQQRRRRRRCEEFYMLLDPQRYSAHRPLFRFDHFLEDPGRPPKLDMLLARPEPSPEALLQHAWNGEDCSEHIYVKEDDPLTVHRHPVAQSTDAVRGKVGFSHGFHVWEVHWPQQQRGTHAVIGVCTKEAPLRIAGYHNLVGFTKHSFGWDIVHCVALTNSSHAAPWGYPASTSDRSLTEVPDRLFCILDMDQGTLAFGTPQEYLGVAFSGLQGLTLYPCISAVWGHCEVTIKYMGSLSVPRSLRDICRRALRYELGPAQMPAVRDLRLPPKLQDYLLFQERPENPFALLPVYRPMLGEGPL